MTKTIDLNCDMGESFGAYTIGDDAAMLELITSANIACGFHGGDPEVIHRTVLQARENGVSVGAHPSFMDLYGFGRRRIAGETPEALKAQLIYQIGAVKALTEAAGARLTHVKTHGALGNMAAEDAELARICVDAVIAVDPTLTFVTLPYSQTMHAAEEAGLHVASEIYADRTYTDEGRLTPRKEAGAVIHDPDQSLAQVLHMILDGHIPTTGGRKLPVKADTLCIHGDNPAAVAVARKLREELERAGIGIAPFRTSAPATA
ncbi:LamB/YcsF family protein [Kaustia mangrovi]|uniref:5-oxoprolinase subunit A n=1 Tax=Kaustia mangrovi TaxID=2593653 RepID=A0A7S8C629_9HYPH|nr:5-oxoprolinase subunit PxpA [Kaustia mangrovi]QPC44088.1 LamB/YcsF family protein [Kaustia mangrovi]